MSTKTTFGRRLNAAMLDLAKRRGEHVTNVEVAEVIGLTGEAIGAWLGDRVESHTIEKTEAVARFLEVCPAWLAWGTEPMRSGECGESRGANAGRTAHVKLAGLANGGRRQKHG